jgi:hypothetical protein
MLTKSQEFAKKEIQKFINDSVNTCMCISGKPGTGKSYFVKEIIPQLIRGKYEYALTATTNKAAAVIDGVTTYSFFGLRVTFKEGDYVINDSNLKKIYNTVIVVDEASMLDWELFKIITTSVSRCKFIFVGDMNQLPAIKGGINVFEKYPVVELTDVVRQKKEDLINVIDKARSNIKKACIMDKIQESNNIHILKTKDEVAEVIKKFGYKDKILAYTNATVIAYNKWFRELTGRSPELQLGDLVVNKTYCSSYVNPSFSMYAEQEGIISDVSEPMVLDLTTRQVYEDPVFEDVAEIPFKVRKVYLMDCEYPFLIAEDAGLHRTLLKATAKEKNWKDHFFLKERISDLRDNMACTVHASQGSTYNNVFIDLRDIKTCRAMSVKTRLIYVALSRAKENIYIYDKE